MSLFLQTSEIRDESVPTHWSKAAEIELYIRRFDQIHPFIHGNKPYKLKGWLALRDQNQAVVSFGGAWSNHLLALAAAGKELGFSTYGIIRGEEPQKWNPVLQKMRDLGMFLLFVSRTVFRSKQSDPEIFQFIRQWGDVLVVPEGGGGMPGLTGASEMVQDSEPYDWIILPGGTGTTTAGIASKLRNSLTRVMAFQVLKGASILRNEVLHHCGIELFDFKNLLIREEFHFGGYARIPEELRRFGREWESETGIALDPVYGLKAMAGTKETAGSGFFKPGSRLLYLHTGGNPELTP
jgi:1-aminocyclopropane-1-carboxylate deaminase